jgi:hypothetical protein
MKRSGFITRTAPLKRTGFSRKASPIRIETDVFKTSVKVKRMRGRPKDKARGEHVQELQAAFNAWIRLRDANEPCISCGRPASSPEQWDAGHYRSVGAQPSLRFSEWNVNKQCLPCNRHLSGNVANYRINLIEKIGRANVDWLEGPHPAVKLTTTEIIEMKAHYRAEVRRMKKEVS